MRTCSRCKKQKANEAFGISRAKACGYKSRCKQCEKEVRDLPENKAKKAIQDRAYQLANPERVRENNGNYKARKKGANVNATQYGWWKTLLSFYDSVCAKCGTTENLELDHIIALNNGGLHEMSNWQLLCRSCNASKQHLHNTDYRPWPRLVDYHGYKRDFDRSGEVVDITEDVGGFFGIA